MCATKGLKRCSVRDICLGTDLAESAYSAELAGLTRNCFSSVSGNAGHDLQHGNNVDKSKHCIHTTLEVKPCPPYSIRPSVMEPSFTENIINQAKHCSDFSQQCSRLPYKTPNASAPKSFQAASVCKEAAQEETDATFPVDPNDVLSPEKDSKSKAGFCSECRENEGNADALQDIDHKPLLSHQIPSHNYSPQLRNSKCTECSTDVNCDGIEQKSVGFTVDLQPLDNLSKTGIQHSSTRIGSPADHSFQESDHSEGCSAPAISLATPRELKINSTSTFGNGVNARKATGNLVPIPDSSAGCSIS